jgi:putative DNA primase/helicase
MELAKKTVAEIYAEAGAATEKDLRANTSRWAHASEKLERLRAAVKLAESIEDIAIKPGAMDTNPWALNVTNCTIDLDGSPRPRPHDRGDLITKVAPVTYDEFADCPIFLAFLFRILGGRTAMVEFVQRCLGYALTGSTRERVLFVLYGTGQNGKSTLLETVAGMLGDYADTIAPRTLMARRDEGVPNDLAAIQGKRLLIASESDQGRRLDVEVVKRLTGGTDKIKARFMRCDWFTFKPEAKIFLATNHKPEIRDTTNSIWDRIRLIPFEVRIPDHEKDVDLPAKLREEWPGILSWLVKGCIDWQEHGLEPPDDVRKAGAAYRSEQDTLAGFLDDRCDFAEDAAVGASELYAAFKTWAADNGEHVVSAKKLGLMLAERGLQKDREGGGGRTRWRGLRVKP